MIESYDVDPAAIDLTDPVFVKGVPWETLAWLREHAPVWWWPAAACWVVTSHELVVQLNRDYEGYSSVGGPTPPGSSINPSVLLAMDPPEHTEYRRMVNRAFTPGAINRLKENVVAIAADAVADFVERGGGDFSTDVAGAVPARVMLDLLGLPRADEAQVVRMAMAVGPSSDLEYRPTADFVFTAFAELGAYLSEQFTQRRAHPGDDLLSMLLEVRHNGEPLPDSELNGFGLQYVFGGTETTRNLLGAGLVELLAHPVQMQRFIDGEVDATTMVNELLRWTSPIVHHSRHATQTRVVGGETIRQGDRVTLWMAAANRDPAVFASPDVLDVGRAPNHHVALGSGGPHYCLGSHLAMLEATATFDALRPHLQRVVAVAAPERLRSNFINGVKHFQVAVR